MALYPEQSSVPSVGTFDQSTEHKTLISKFGQAETRRQKWLYPLRSFDLKYETLSKSEAQTLFDFYMERKGRFEAFNFFHPFSNTYVKEYTGTADGSQVLWNLPFKIGSGVTVYVGDSAQTTPTNYTIDQSAGADGADRLTFVVAPQAGAVITVSFTGYLKVRCRFGSDVFDLETMFNLLCSTGIKLKGLLNE